MKTYIKTQNGAVIHDPIRAVWFPAQAGHPLYDEMISLVESGEATLEEPREPNEEEMLLMRLKGVPQCEVNLAIIEALLFNDKHRLTEIYNRVKQTPNTYGKSK